MHEIIVTNIIVVETIKMEISTVIFLLRNYCWLFFQYNGKKTRLII